MMQPLLVTAQAFVDSHLVWTVVTTPIFGFTSGLYRLELGDEILRREL